MIRSGIALLLPQLSKSFGVRPQVSPVFDPASSVPASRRRVAPCETWAVPSFSPPHHQSRIAAVRPYATKLKFDSESTLFVMRVAAEDGSGLMERSEKPGSDPIFGEGISPA